LGAIQISLLFQKTNERESLSFNVHNGEAETRREWLFLVAAADFPGCGPSAPTFAYASQFRICALGTQSQLRPQWKVSFGGKPKERGNLVLNVLAVLRMSIRLIPNTDLTQDQHGKPMADEVDMNPVQLTTEYDFLAASNFWRAWREAAYPFSGYVFPQKNLPTWRRPLGPSSGPPRPSKRRTSTAPRQLSRRFTAVSVFRAIPVRGLDELTEWGSQR